MKYELPSTNANPNTNHNPSHNPTPNPKAQPQLQPQTKTRPQGHTFRHSPECPQLLDRDVRVAVDVQPLLGRIRRLPSLRVLELVVQELERTHNAENAEYIHHTE